MAVDVDARVNANKAEEVISDVSMPSWFMENCVKTAFELSQEARRIVILPPNPPNHTEKVQDTTINGQESQEERYELDSFLYDELLNLVMPKDKAILPKQQAEGLGATFTSEKTPKFALDAVQLLLPGGFHAFLGQEFLSEVAKKFASDVQADLIELNIDDFRDLAEHFGNGEDSEQRDDQRRGDDHYLNLLYDQCMCVELCCPASSVCTTSRSSSPVTRSASSESASDSSESSVGTTNSQEYEFLCRRGSRRSRKKLFSFLQYLGLLTFATILVLMVIAIFGREHHFPSQIDVKDVVKDLQQHGLNFISRRRGITKIHQTGVSIDKPEEMEIADRRRFQYTTLFKNVIESHLMKKTLEKHEENNKVGSPALVVLVSGVGRFCNYQKYLQVFKHLQAAIRTLSKENTIVMMLGGDDEDILNSVSNQTQKGIMRMFTARSQEQYRLLEKDKENARLKENIRHLQRCIRMSPEAKMSPLAQPYTVDWETFIPDATLRAMRRHFFPWDNIEIIARRAAKGKLDIDSMKIVMETYEKRNEAEKQWLEKHEDKDDLKEPWKSKLPQRAWSIAEQISKSQQDEHLYQLLDTVVSPGDLNTTWSNIELDSDIKARITDIISLGESQKDSCGILKTSAGGALLYGPPGTGKTQLARVLAKTSGSIMLSVSGAEMESKYVGETEKLVASLFKLGKMLFPSIIFIDEADSLFSSRSQGGSGSIYQRKLVNQLLQEADGLSKDSNSPFLLLATNLPHLLDPAVLRRVPCRIYIGLPTISARENMFRMFLKEESLDRSVDLKKLAEVTHRYTGSDIMALCVETAVISQREYRNTEAGESLHVKSSRILNISHFHQALKSNTPTTSPQLMQEMRRFAQMYDKSAVSRMVLYQYW
ncbi:AAA family ATPase [Botrytis cinerea]